MPAKKKKEQSNIVRLPNMAMRCRRLKAEIKRGAETIVPAKTDVVQRVIDGMASEFRKLKKIIGSMRQEIAAQNQIIGRIEQRVGL